MNDSMNILHTLSDAINDLMLGQKEFKLADLMNILTTLRSAIADLITENEALRVSRDSWKHAAELRSKEIEEDEQKDE